MYILHINSEKDVSKVDKMIKQGNDVFILIYMDKCGPCNATRKEWEKIGSALTNQYSKNDKLVIIDVNKNFLPSIKHIGKVDGFPTIKYIGNYGKTIESYENSSVKIDRSVNSFINWIESKINKMVSTTPISSVEHVYKRLSKTQKNNKPHNKKTHHNKKGHKGGKWSKKYKLSINCNNPKGFSQRQYCKYGRNK